MYHGREPCKIECELPVVCGEGAIQLSETAHQDRDTHETLLVTIQEYGIMEGFAPAFVI